VTVLDGLVLDGGPAVLSVSSENGSALTGVTLTPVDETSNPRQFTLTIDPTVAAQPFRIVARGSRRNLVDSRDGSFKNHVGTVYYNGAARFYVRNGAAPLAPRLTAVGAGVAPGGSGIISFLGSNFDAAATFVSEDGFSMMGSQDGLAGQVDATLTLPANAPTGMRYSYAETAAGRSNRVALAVAAPREAPVLHGIFPNYAPIGRASEVQFGGEHFTTGAQVQVGQPENLLDGRLAVAASAFLLNQTFRPAGVPRTEPVRIDSLGRVVGPVDFFVQPAGFAGPRIRAIHTPDGDRLIAGALNPVSIEWRNLESSEEPDVIVLPNAQSAQPITSARLFPALDESPRPLSAGVLDVAAVTGPDTIFLAVRTDDGLTTNLVSLPVVPPPADKPFLRRTTLGRIARSGEVIDAVFGERLTGVNRVNFIGGGVRAEIVPGTVTDTSFQMRVTADATATLTGDRSTSFEVRTPRGFSNHLSYRVERAGSGGGNAPIIDIVAPNWIYDDFSLFGVTLHGANFEPDATEAIFSPASAVAEVDVTVEPFDRTSAHLFFERGPGALPAALGLALSTPGGQTSAGDLAVLDRATQQGPNPVSFTPNLVVRSGVKAQFGIVSGEGFFNETGVTFVWIPNPASPATNAIGTFYPERTVGSSVRGVVEIDPFIAPGTTQVDGRFLLRRADGLTTRAVRITVQAAPAPGTPVVRRVEISGTLSPGGGARSVALHGSNLTGASGVSFTSTGVTAGLITDITPDGTEVRTSFTVAPGSPVTGDALTGCILSTPAGISNTASFIISP
jgi:hypothetical protein